MLVVDSYLERLESLGRRARELRILRQMQQRELAVHAGVSLGTVARFERTGKASIENVLRIAAALGADEAFAHLFEPPKYRTLDEALSVPAASRQRVRKPR